MSRAPDSLLPFHRTDRRPGRHGECALLGNEPSTDRPQAPLPAPGLREKRGLWRSEEHTSELQSLMRISYAVFCLKKKKKSINKSQTITRQLRETTTNQTVDRVIHTD